MKKLLALFVILVVSLVLVSPVKALEYSKLNGLRELKLQKKAEAREDIRTKVASGEGKLLETKRRVVGLYLSQMIKRLEAAITRLEVLIGKIESRQAKVQEINGTTEEALSVDIEKAKSILANAKTKLDEVKTMGTNLLTSETPKEDFKLLKASIEAIKKDLVEAHRLLVKTIGNLKGLRTGQ